MYDGSVLAISKARKTELAGSQTPIIDFTLRAKVAHRGQYRCAITKAFGRARSDKQAKEGRFDEIPDAAQLVMHAAQFIPCLPNNFNDKVVDSPEVTDAARTWDILRSWTRFDFPTLVGPNTNSPASVIYMTRKENFWSF
jgi:hypothetical protein